MDTKRKKIITGSRKQLARQSGKKKVMVVDDDPDFLEEVRDMLTEHGYKLMLITNGVEALRSARKHKPDVILLDIVMGNMNGFQVADGLNKWPETAKIPVIAITGWFVREEHDRLMKTRGIRSVLMKPFKPSDVVSCIESVLNGKKH
jgi:CheY-like chemotaxis protein